MICPAFGSLNQNWTLENRMIPGRFLLRSSSWRLGHAIAYLLAEKFHEWMRPETSRLLKKGQIHLLQVFVDGQASAGPSGRVLRLPK